MNNSEERTREKDKGQGMDHTHNTLRLLHMRTSTTHQRRHHPCTSQTRKIQTLTNLAPYRSYHEPKTTRPTDPVTKRNNNKRTATMNTHTLLSLLLLTAAAPIVYCSSTLSVLEVGQAGRRVTRVTQSSQGSTSVHAAAAASFVSAMHEVSHNVLEKKNWSTTGRLQAEKGRRYVKQEAGMAMVPDMFQRADGGLAVFLVSTEEREEQLQMLVRQPTYAKIVQDRVGALEMEGDESLMQALFSSSDVPVVSSQASEEDVLAKVADVVTKTGNELQAISIEVEDAVQADQKLATIVNGLQKEKGTYVLHVVLEDAAMSRRRLTSNNASQQQRNLGESEDGERDEDREEDRNEENDQNNNQQNDQNNNQQNDQNNNQQNDQDGDDRDGNGYYSSSQDEDFISMYDIQYFNVTLWTALGLLTVLFYTVLLMINMPLMADTLLFGESAKMVAA